jgi:ABC-type multidrug transport system fused ATPase/permease subunit
MEEIINAARKANIHDFIHQLPQVTLDKIKWGICSDCK